MMMKISCLLRVIFLLGNFFLPVGSSNCSGRRILREEEGSIAIGNGNKEIYDNDMHCEWLIDAGSPNRTIHLMFDRMDTECSFDFLFIYDGNTYNRRLIASLSGNSLPDPVIAHSGYMLLFLFTDRNYKKTGFQVHYKITDCPWGCSGHGVCKNNTCDCDTDYSGLGCQVENCPDNCGAHGHCHTHSYNHEECQCDPGYLGKDCSLQAAGHRGQGKWYKVRDNEEAGSIPNRTSHTSVFIGDCIWVFGGFDLNQMFDDLWRYCLFENKWQVFDRDESLFSDYNNEKEMDKNIGDESSGAWRQWPEPRSEHASDSYRDNFFVYGGLLVNGSHSNELWHFNTTSLEWTLVATNSVVKPHSAMGHTLTTVGHFLYLLGGKSDDRFFLDSIFRIDARNLTQWERIFVKGGNYPRKRFLGHSTIYHKESNSLLVFGGYKQVSGLFSDRSREILAFNLDTHYWTLLSNPNWQENSMPRDKAFHSALIMGNYMVVYGGNTHKHSDEEICYHGGMFLYHLGCHVWVNHTYFTGTSMPIKGRFGHTAVAANGNIMFVFGGYSGTVLGDLWAYKLPSAVADFKCPVGSRLCSHNVSDDDVSVSSTPSPSTPHPPHRHRRRRRRRRPRPHKVDHCEAYRSHKLCQDDPECVYCHKGRNDEFNTTSCVHWDKHRLCKDKDFHKKDDHCEAYRGHKLCQDDPECVYCRKGRNDEFNTTSCVHRDRTSLCKDKDFYDSVGRCPGICPSLRTCGGCISQGKGSTQKPLSVRIKACSWCVKEAQCQTLTDPFGTCLKASDTQSGVRGWWGGRSASLTRFDQCQSDDLPSGLVLIKYKSPANDSYPDKVEITRSIYLNMSAKKPEKQLEDSFNLTAILKGYIHPLNAPTTRGENLTLTLQVMSAEAKLFLSTDDKEDNEELVISAKSQMAVEDKVAVRPSRLAVFPNTSLGHKYWVKQVTEVAKEEEARITMTWNMRYRPIKNGSGAKYLSSEFLEPFSNGNCSTSYNCFACLSDVLCGWCEASRQCVLRNSNKSVCQAQEAESRFLITSPGECPDCNVHIDCINCAEDPLCEWDSTEAHCTRRFRILDAVTNSSLCRPPCHLRYNCTDCILEESECAWCQDTHTCLHFVEYMTHYIYGQCKSWVDNVAVTPEDAVQKPVSSKCQSCSASKTCDKCLRQFGCGWCSNEYNPLIGLCLDGDFAGMESNHTCSRQLALNYNMSDNESSLWSYDRCPDVDECKLGLHTCHGNASCINTYSSFKCQCKRGYIGDGSNFCDKTCYYECVHGFCSGPPAFECDCNIGWTNDSCDVDCGCNNRSTCRQGVGVCDACQELTAGPHCEQCVAGAYVDPQDPEKCIPCECNGHADKSMGECDNVTGKCLCTDKTYGDHCEYCMPGYYGNSRNSGRCYLGCDQRTFLTNVTKGSLGFHEGHNPHAHDLVYCLWVLSAYDTFHTASSHNSVTTHSRATTAMAMRLDGIPAQTATIQVTVESDLKVECGRDAVYVYDAIPWFIAGGEEGSGKLLGSFCGTNPGGDRTVRAHSGVATILFQADLLRSKTRGFNATYLVHSCPNGCHGNRICLQGGCVCKSDYWGPGCDTPICPQNCHQRRNQGICRDNICICRPGFTGVSCERKVGTNDLDLQILSDSRLIQGPGLERRQQEYHQQYQQQNRLAFVEHKYDNFNKFRPSGHRGRKHGPVEDGEEEEVEMGNDGMDDVYGPSARAGHSLTHCGNGLLFVYGGLSVQHVILGDMWMYNVTSGVWTKIESPSTIKPPGRYYHAAACIPQLKIIYVFGGFEADHTGSVASLGVRANNSLWKFNIESYAWTTENSPPWLPGLAGHTLTHMGMTKLVLIGGFSATDYFNDKVYEYNVSNGIIAWAQWTGMTGAVPIGVYGHSAVFEKATDTIYVYGGYLFRSDQWFVSDELLTLDVTDKTWNLLYPNPNSWWEERVFHTAVSLGDKMAVIGGLTSGGIYANDIMVFRYRCSTWHRVTFKEMGYQQDTISMFGLASATLHEAIYIFGGFSGTSSGRLSRITLPSDLCALITDPLECQGLAGCQICGGTLCYNAEGNNITQPLGCMGPPPKEKRCDERNYKRRKCSHHKTCSHCLASHPHFKNTEPMCNWCITCPENVCIPRDKKCPLTKPCNVHTTITSVSDCYEYFCPASNCQRCGQRENCLWTRHFERSSESKRNFNRSPVFNWNCVTLNMQPAATSKFESMPPEPCPRTCQQYKSCKSCLDSPGAEGGSKECVWSHTLRECMAPAYVFLHCGQGECGHLYRGRLYQCPQSCHNNHKCADCIATPGCGWCAFGGGNGQGMCMPGGVLEPSQGVCVEGNHSLAAKAVSTKLSPIHHANAIWSYHQCQPENECKNGHHTCDPKTQDCHDKLKDFMCTCKHGYVKNKNGNCEPVCHQGCVHGTCYEPDSCRCDFGWVGNNCSVECKCNKHSNCPDVSSTTECSYCANNTMGSRCQNCQKNFVGNPKNGGRCVPCREFCNNHTDYCMTQNENDNYRLGQLYHEPFNGPLEAEAVCIDCLHNTTGVKCEKCTSGHFRTHGQSPTQPCQECHCNGHSSVCDTDTGRNCKCKNNTETNCDAKEESQCWKHQCAQCKEYFVGTPTEGHQCYRQMTVDRDYCLDPVTQKNCDQVPQPLLQGRTVFFAVQPKYLNVNIRITIDVTMGSADIFLSNEKDTYQVFLDRDQFYHEVHLDKQYVPAHATLARRSVHEGHRSGIRGGNSDGMSVEDIVVNDEAAGRTVFESESVRITEEVPNFLKLKSSDAGFYKMSQFKSAEKARREKENDQVNEGEEQEVDGKGKGKVKAGDREGIGRSVKAMHKKHSIVKEKSMSHPSSDNEVLLKPKKRRKGKKKEKKQGGFKSHTSHVHWEFLKKVRKYEEIDRSNPRRRHRRGLYLYSRLFGQVRSGRGRRDYRRKILVEEDEEDGKRGRKKRWQKWMKEEQVGYRSRRGTVGTSVTDSKNTREGGGGVTGVGVKIGEVKAGALNTYITVSRHNSVLVVRDVRFRLVIMLPRDQHDLKSSRFYIIARSRGGNSHNATFGNLYFRQDQPHIDLFVFFSVFFSCFFLFLSVCVLLWKLKQTFDARRSRQMREREMECMASRPFARILVLLEPEGIVGVLGGLINTTAPTPVTTVPPAPTRPHIISSNHQLVPRRYRLTRGSGGGGHNNRGGPLQQQALHNGSLLPNDHHHHSLLTTPSGGGRDKDLGVVPIGIEPTDDNLAAISTVLFQLPGGATAPARLCLGSALTTRLVPSSHWAKTGNLRRRTSASSC